MVAVRASGEFAGSQLNERTFDPSVRSTNCVPGAKLMRPMLLATQAAWSSAAALHLVCDGRPRRYHRVPDEHEAGALVTVGSRP